MPEKVSEISYCPICDITRVDGRFCRTCGTVLIPKPSNPDCPDCGKELSESDNYCRWCGSEVKISNEIKDNVS